MTDWGDAVFLDEIFDRIVEWRRSAGGCLVMKKLVEHWGSTCNRVFRLIELRLWAHLDRVGEDTVGLTLIALGMNCCVHSHHSLGHGPWHLLLFSEGNTPSQEKRMWAYQAVDR